MTTKEAPIRYTDLLDIDWVIKKSILSAMDKYREMSANYEDENDLLVRLAREDVDDLKAARKTLHEVVEVLKENKLYYTGR
ncbi:hypothetical protein H8E06_00305 [bacterium]|nr:hypothetical protein [bacterium]